MRRVPLPKEVRPGFGAFVQAVPLLFRLETLELTALLVAASFGLAVAWDLLNPGRGFAWQLSGGLVLRPLDLARDFSFALLRVAVVLMLVPVATGDRGLRPRVLSVHFGDLALTTAVVVGVPEALDALVHWLELQSPGAVVSAIDWRTIRHGVVPMGLTAWAAWYLGNAVRRRERRPASRVRLLFLPGFAAAAALGAIATLLGRGFDYGGPTLLRRLSVGPVYATVSSVAWVLLHLFTALWMLRAVENEADADPRPDGSAG